jgi:hypothetical protein
MEINCYKKQDKGSHTNARANTGLLYDVLYYSENCLVVNKMP